MALIPTDTTASPTRCAVDIPLHHRMTITSSSPNRPIRSVGDGLVSCIRDMWSHSTNTAVDTRSLPPACLPLFADPLHSLSLCMAHSCTYSFIRSSTVVRATRCPPSRTRCWLRGVRRPSDLTHIGHRTHPIESDLTGPDRMGPQPTSGAPAGAAWLGLPILTPTPTPTNRRHDDQYVRERPRPRTMRQRTTPHGS